MKKPEFEYMLPNWEKIKSDEYKLRYFRSHVERSIETFERKQQIVEDFRSAYWLRARGFVNAVNNGEKCICVPRGAITLKN